MVRRRPALALLPLAVLFLVMGLVEAWRDSPTVDEAVDISSGVTTLVRHDLRLNPEHGVLSQVLPALPVLFVHPVVPDGPGYESGDWFDHTDEFMRANAAAGRLHRIVFVARLVPLLEALAVAALLYVLAARLFGPWPGVVAAALWLTTPVFIGFGHVVSIDVAFTVTTLLVSLAMLHWFEEPSDRRAVLLGLAAAAAALTRHIGITLAVVAAIVLVVHGWKTARRAAVRQAAIVGLVMWASIWVVVRVVSPLGTGGAAGSRLDDIISTARHHSTFISVLLAIPWPREWAAGVGFGALQTEGTHLSYLLGHSWTGSQWWYFLGTILVKLPIVALLVLVVGPFGMRKAARVPVRQVVAVVVVPAVAIYVVISVQPFDRGLRYAFPVVALWFVAAAPVVEMGREAWRRVGAVALVATQVAAMVVAFPHSIAWTPPPFQPGYRWASDTNIDFGQDFDEVTEWTKGRDPLVDLLFPRGFDLPRTQRLLEVDPADVRGWVAVSATRLTTLDRDALSWLRAYCPVDTIGGSVLIYRFDAPVDPRPGPVMPVGMCAGSSSVRTG